MYRVILKRCLALCLLVACKSGMHAQDYVSYVDPYIGSGGHGHVFVGASVPFGGVQLGPTNFYKGWDWCSGYHYGDSIMIGFSHLHLSGTGIGDLNDILVMPYTGALKTNKATENAYREGYGSKYSHKEETVAPGYYAVTLQDYDIRAELTATERVGLHRYRFPQNSNGHIVIDLAEGVNDQSTQTFIKKIDAYTLEGYRFSKGWAKDQWQFFAIRFQEPLEKFGVYDAQQQLLGTDSAAAKAVKGIISFKAVPQQVLFKVGLSPVSMEGALHNIEAEMPGWDFDEVRNAAVSKWNKELSRVDVETTDPKEKRIFYTSLYHTMINPMLFNDHNGDYRGADKKVYQNPAFDNYSVFSLWDTYRATHPLFALLFPSRTSHMINSMLAIFDQQGKLPIWHLVGNETGTMVGISSLQVIAEAYLKGIKGFDGERAYKAIKATSMSDSLGLMFVKNMRAIPSDRQRSSVAKGLEYAIGDGSIALMAKRMGKLNDYDYYSKRAKNYRLYYDASKQFFRGKLADGNWTPGFSSLSAKNSLFAEGNAWQYLWLVPQDVRGLIDLLGGEMRFNKRLDSMFTLETTPEEKGLVDLTGTIGQYAHGNEPSHHIAYLYAYSGQQFKTAPIARKIMREMYHDQPDGIIGNEDCGQMSAWYIFSAMGIYPVFPASGKYVFGSPLVNKATLHLESGKRFIIEAKNNSTTNIYIQSVTLNGKPYKHAYITHEDIEKGGHLEFNMGAKPNMMFAKNRIDRP